MIRSRNSLISIFNSVPKQYKFLGICPTIHGFCLSGSTGSTATRTVFVVSTKLDVVVVVVEVVVVLGLSVVVLDFVVVTFSVGLGFGGATRALSGWALK